MTQGARHVVQRQCDTYGGENNAVRLVALFTWENYQMNHPNDPDYALAVDNLLEGDAAGAASAEDFAANTKIRKFESRKRKTTGGASASSSQPSGQDAKGECVKQQQLEAAKKMPKRGKGKGRS